MRRLTRRRGHPNHHKMPRPTMPPPTMPPPTIAPPTIAPLRMPPLATSVLTAVAGVAADVAIVAGVPTTAIMATTIPGKARLRDQETLEHRRESLLPHYRNRLFQW